MHPEKYPNTDTSVAWHCGYIGGRLACGELAASSPIEIGGDKRTMANSESPNSSHHSSSPDNDSQSNNELRE